MPGIVDVAGVEVYGKGRGLYDLPCGHVDPQGKTHRTVILREMTGEEEDIMDDDELPTPERYTKVLSACCEKIGEIDDPDAIEQIIGDDLKAGLPITSSDRIAMLIFLRRVSVGDIFKFQRRCPRCGHINRNKQLDLRTLEIKQVPEERVAKRRVAITLRRSGRKAVVRVLTAKKEQAITGLRLNQKDLRSFALLARLESLEVEVTAPCPEGVSEEEHAKAPKVVKVHTMDDPVKDLALVKALPKDDRNQLREIYNVIEADVDTTVTVACDGRICNAEFEFPLDLGQAFFSNQGTERVSAETLEWL